MKQTDVSTVTAAPEIKPLMSSDEAAKALGISLRGLQSLAKQGRIPGAVKVGYLWRFNRAKLEAFIAGE